MNQVNTRFDSPLKIKSSSNDVVAGTVQPNFGEAASFSAPRSSYVVSTMDAVARGGLVASFCLQDGLGCIIPRFATGLTRNREETGEINVKFAIEELLREFLTGPGMFAIPAIVLYSGVRLFGKANNVPVDYIKNLGSLFKDNVDKYAGLDDVKVQKKAFYTDVFKNVLSESCNDTKSAEAFAQELLELEGAKSKGFWKHLKGVEQKGSAEDLLKELDAKFVELRKKTSLNVSEDLAAVKMKGFGDGTSFKTFVSHLRNYTDDALDTLKKADKSDLSKFFEQFNFSRIASRSIMNTAMTAGVLAFVAFVPFLYKINKHYPGTLGAEDANKSTVAEKDATEKKPDKVDEKDSAKTNADKPENAKDARNFTGLADIGKKITNNEALSNFLKKNEYSGISMSFPALVTIVLSVPIPRLLTARDENDFWDTIFRDIPTIAAILLGVKAIRNFLADMFTRSSGFALANKPPQDMGFLKRTFSNRAFSSDYITNKYSDIHNYKNGMSDFIDFIDAQGGDIKKLLAFDSGTNEALSKLHEKWTKGKEYKALDKMTNKDVKQMFEDMKSVASDELSKILDAFKGPKNKFVDRAKNLNSKFDCIATFLLIPACLGVLIPKMNEYLSKRRTLKREEEKAKEVSAPEIDRTKQALAKEFRAFGS